jgi:hypothetical protein
MRESERYVPPAKSLMGGKTLYDITTSIARGWTWDETPGMSGLGTYLFV